MNPRPAARRHLLIMEPAMNNLSDGVISRPAACGVSCQVRHGDVDDSATMTS